MVLEESQLYRDLMRLRPDGWTANAWAVRAGVSRTVWSDMRRHGNPSRRTLEKLLAVAGSSLAEFEALRVGDVPVREESSASGVGDRTAPEWHGSAHPALPLIAASPGGTWAAADIQVILTELRRDRIIERLPRPVSLAGDPGAYAFIIGSDAMWPRFRSGRRIAVSPMADLESGDDALITISGMADGRALVFIAELVRRSDASAELRQFNPEVIFHISTGQFTGIHKVMGELF